MADYPNPYAPEHLQQLNDVLRASSEAESLCADCESIGVPFPDERESNRRAQEIALRIKRKWFPNSP